MLVVQYTFNIWGVHCLRAVSHILFSFRVQNQSMPVWYLLAVAFILPRRLGTLTYLEEAGFT